MWFTCTHPLAGYFRSLEESGRNPHIEPTAGQGDPDDRDPVKRVGFASGWDGLTGFLVVIADKEGDFAHGSASGERTRFAGRDRTELVPNGAARARLARSPSLFHCRGINGLMPVRDLPIGDPVESPPPTDVYDEAESRIETETGKRAQRILDRLASEYPDMYCFLDGESPFQILVATILSAQSTDETVNEVTPELFAEYPTPETLAAAPRDHVEELIYSTGFYRSKAEYIQESAQQVLDEHGGEVPPRLSDLVELPGVARKTATAVLWWAYGRIEGVTVDTHVLRLSQRLGVSDSENPDVVERDWMALVPQDRWPWVTFELINHGRAICSARSPACRDCVVSNPCPSAFTFGE